MSVQPALAPLSHHDILALAAPFSRRGLRVDLAASQRQQRRLLFQAQPVASEQPELAGLVQVLQLDCHAGGHFTLLRTLSSPGGLQAQVEASGADAAALLAQVDAVAPERQFRVEGGQHLARSYRLDSAGQPLLTQARLQLGGLDLSMHVMPVRGVSAELQLHGAQGQALALPEDLLAVLGWDWSPLQPLAASRGAAGGWKARLRLRGDHARRSHRAEQGLDECAAHLARTLAEAPGRFHERHRAARWGVVLRRALPLLTPLLLVLVVLLSPKVDVGEHPGLFLLVYHLPTLLIALSFCLQEMPRFEIPPLPRVQPGADWQAGAAAPR